VIARYHLGHARVRDAPLNTTHKIQTTFVQLTFKKFNQGLRMFSRFVVVLDDLSEFAEPSVEGCDIRFVVNRRLIHVVKDLLCNQIGRW
jgi:hypothetical protein